MAMFNNSVRKPFIIAHTDALSHRGGGILSYLCGVDEGFSPGDYVQRGFCPFPRAVGGR